MKYASEMKFKYIGIKFLFSRVGRILASFPRLARTTETIDRITMNYTAMKSSRLFSDLKYMKYKNRETSSNVSTNFAWYSWRQKFLSASSVDIKENIFLDTSVPRRLQRISVRF